MSELDRMLVEPAEHALPPLIRFYKKRIDAGDTVQVEVYRPDGLPGASGAELVIHRVEDNKEQKPEPVEWDDGLNVGLVELGVQAIDAKNEAERFALGIRAALRRAERRYGDGYVNAVLIDLLDDSDLSLDGAISDVRKHIQTPRAAHTAGYQNCREDIAAAIGGRAVELRDKLSYAPDQVKAIMANALAICLDQRFSVSNSRRFGLL